MRCQKSRPSPKRKQPGLFGDAGPKQDDGAAEVVDRLPPQPPRIARPPLPVALPMRAAAARGFALLGLLSFGTRSAPSSFKSPAIARVDQFFLELRLFVGRHRRFIGLRRQILYLGISALFRSCSGFSPRVRAHAEPEARQQQHFCSQRRGFSIPRHHFSTCSQSLCSAGAAEAWKTRGIEAPRLFSKSNGPRLA